MSKAPSSDLNRAGAQIVGRLGGLWAGRQGMCLCPAHADRTPSLSVRVGQRSLLFKCFAGCETIDILRAIRDLRFSVPRLSAPDQRQAAPSSNAAMLARAQQIWGEAALIHGGLAGRYLRDRHLAARPAALRFHARTPMGRGRHVQFRPAIIAAVQEGSRLVAVQRLFLNPTGRGLAPDMPKAKLSLARPLRGAVQLAPAQSILGLAEGVETAMAASVLLDIPVWATLGAERLHQIWVPDSVEHLLLLPDNDLSGRRGAARAMEAYGGSGRRIDVLWPWNARNDWSDVLAERWSAGGKKGVGRTRDAA